MTRQWITGIVLTGIVLGVSFAVVITIPYSLRSERSLKQGVLPTSFGLVSSANAASSSEISSPPDAAADRAALIREFEEHIAAHETEKPDDAWAVQTSNRIHQTLKALEQEGRFTLLKVDCKSRTCLAWIQWGNLPAAQGNFDKLLMADFGVRCFTEILLRSPPTDLSVKYEEVMYLRCR
jgi:hypothetical protein